MLLLIGDARDRRAPGRLPDRSRQRLPAGVNVLDPVARRGPDLRGHPAERAARAPQGEPRPRPDQPDRPAHRLPRRWRSAWSCGSPTRTAASPTCSCWSASSCCSGASSSAARASGATSTRWAAAPRPRARAGINVDRIKIMCFAICSFMAAVGGLILASRLRSVDTNAGGGEILLYSIAAAVIGGTSLFGGIGHIKSALLGALVIASIDNGLGLLGLGSGEKFVITGGVLLLAVTVDSLSRKQAGADRESLTLHARASLDGRDQPEARHGRARCRRGRARGHRVARPRTRGGAGRRVRHRARTRVLRGGARGPRGGRGLHPAARTRSMSSGPCGRSRRASTCSARSRCRATRRRSSAPSTPPSAPAACSPRRSCGAITRRPGGSSSCSRGSAS